MGVLEEETAGLYSGSRRLEGDQPYLIWLGAYYTLVRGGNQERKCFQMVMRPEAIATAVADTVR